MRLQIRHIPGLQGEPRFVVGCDGRYADEDAAVLSSPVEVSVGTHNAKLAHDLRWYLELVFDFKRR